MKWKEEMELKMTEKANRESPAAKIKMWGDALRNTISRMPTEGIDVVTWFVSVEKFFEQLYKCASRIAVCFDQTILFREGKNVDA